MSEQHHKYTLESMKPTEPAGGTPRSDEAGRIAMAIVATGPVTLETYAEGCKIVLERARQLERELAEETAIVGRVWKALGIDTYEKAKPYAIDEHVAVLRADAQRLKRIRVAYKAGIIQSGNGTGYIDVLLEMEREDVALKARP